MKILFVNACVRGNVSNTLKLCRYTLERLQEKYPDAEIEEVNLLQDRPLPIYGEEAQLRSELREANDWEHPMFSYAKQFASADFVVIGAPYWDLAFPSVLKVYFERICVVGITFEYSPEGKISGLCKADKLLYISTAGAPVVPLNLGFDYIAALGEKFFGITEAIPYTLCGMETGQDIIPLMEKAEEDLTQIALTV